MSQMPFVNPYGFMPPPFQQRTNNTQTDSFLAFMQDGKVFRQTPEGPQQIGVTSKTHDDLQSSYDDLYKRTQEYYDALVEHGIITPEPTQEELLRRQSEQLKEQAAQLANASKVIAESAKNQKALENMLINLQNEIASLKQPCAVEIEGEVENEFSANNFEQSANYETMEAISQSSSNESVGLSPIPKRHNASSGGTSRQYAGTSKRAGVSSNRPTRKDS